MQIRKINSSPNFGAKFIQSDDLKRVVEYAVEKDEFCKLNEARKNIEKYYLPYRLRFELFETSDNEPFIIFTRFKPKNFVAFPKNINDYIESEPIIYESHKKMNPLEYGLKKLLAMGQNLPHNKLFKRVVINGGDVHKTK